MSKFKTLAEIAEILFNEVEVPILAGRVFQDFLNDLKVDADIKDGLYFSFIDEYFFNKLKGVNSTDKTTAIITLRENILDAWYPYTVKTNGVYNVGDRLYHGFTEVIIQEFISNDYVIASGKVYLLNELTVVPRNMGN